jgi:hypothetical protein
MPHSSGLGFVAGALLVLGTGLGPQGAKLSGGVTDAVTGAKLAGVEVRVGDSLKATTDAKGQFSLDDVAPGTYRGQLSLEGYRQKWVQVEVRKKDHRLFLAAVLEPAGAEPDSAEDGKDTATVVAYEPYVDFYRRRHLGLGYFFTSRDIARINPHRVTDLLRDIPGVWFTYDRRGEAFLSFHLGPSPANGCVPAIYLDGAKAGGGFIGLDALVHPNRIEGLEVYTGLPLRPMDFPESCAIIVWTR